MIRLSKIVKSMSLLAFLSLVTAIPAFGQVKAEDPGDCLPRYHIYLQSLEVHYGGLNVFNRLDSRAKPERKIVEKPARHAGGHSVDGDLAVFIGSVNVSSGFIKIGDRGGTGDLYGPVSAVFHGPVKTITLMAKNGGRAEFNDTVYSWDIYLEGRRKAETSLTFHGPVSVVVGNIHLSGDSSAVFMNEVMAVTGGSLKLDDADSRASVTVGGPGRIDLVGTVVWEAGVDPKWGEGLKVAGGNRLIFSLSPSRPTDGFIKTGRAAIDADCLVIDNHDDVLKEGAEIILINGEELKINGDNRKIVTKQNDEFELLVSENQISAKLVKRARRVEEMDSGGQWEFTMGSMF